MYSVQLLHQIWRLRLTKWAQEYKKRIWTFFGSKIGQSVPIAMELEVDAWCHLLDVCKSSKLRNSNCKNPANKSLMLDGMPFI